MQDIEWLSDDQKAIMANAKASAKDFAGVALLKISKHYKNEVKDLITMAGKQGYGGAFDEANFVKCSKLVQNQGRILFTDDTIIGVANLAFLRLDGQQAMAAKLKAPEFYHFVVDPLGEIWGNIEIARAAYAGNGIERWTGMFGQNVNRHRIAEFPQLKRFGPLPSDPETRERYHAQATARVQMDALYKLASNAQQEFNELHNAFTL